MGKIVSTVIAENGRWQFAGTEKLPDSGLQILDQLYGECEKPTLWML